MNREQMMYEELHVGLMTAKFAKRVGHHAVPRHSGRDADAQRPRFAEGDPLSTSRRVFDVLQDASRVVQEQRSSRTQSNAARQSVEQRKANLPLQILDLPREWRLSDVEASRRPPEMLLLANRDEIAQMP